MMTRIEAPTQQVPFTSLLVGPSYANSYIMNTYNDWAYVDQHSYINTPTTHKAHKKKYSPTML